MCPGCLGHGTRTEPVVICGDASGGKDSRDDRLRRVGLSIVIIGQFEPAPISCTVSGPLMGTPQTVPRGELSALELGIRLTTGHLTFVSDNDEVVR
eukprot:5733299-Pyramimonas_sp.AAC.1